PAPHPQRAAGLSWIRSLQVPAAAGYEYEAPHSDLHAIRAAAAADDFQDGCLSIRDTIFTSYQRACVPAPGGPGGGLMHLRGTMSHFPRCPVGACAPR